MKKIILPLASYLLLLASSFAQEIEWQNTIGGSSSDNLYMIRQTDDGGYIMGGYSNSDISGDKSENSIGGLDYWIVKTDSLGNIQWQNTIGGGGTEILSTIQQTADGGYILGGWSASDISGDKTEDAIGSSDYWIVKTDASGNIQWQNTIGGSLDDELYSIQQTADGGYILGGHSNSNISGDKTENRFGEFDFWIVKTDAAGNIQWQNTIGADVFDWLYSIQQTDDGGYILGGYSVSNISGDKTENCIGGYDYWIVKTDSLGNIQWQNTIGGSNNDELKSVQQTSDGGYILGGYSASNISGDKTENSIGAGGLDYWLVKTDALGIIQWQNTIGGSAYDYLNSIQQTTDGGYILGGYSLSDISGDKTENTNGNFMFWDYWIVKTDSLGNIRWQNTIAGADQDLLYSVQQTADGRYILGGVSLSNISGDKTENCIGGYPDYWIIKLTDKYNSITGKCFIDANSNNVQDGGELNVTNKQVTEINTGRFGFSQQNGNYSVAVLDTGNFTAFASSISYYNPSPLNYNVYFSGIQQTDSLNDFAFQPAGVFNDLCVTITPLAAFRTGMNSSYMINYENAGTTTLNPTVIFFPDNHITFVSSIPAASSVTPDSAVWTFGPLVPFQSGSILVTVHVNVGTPIGTYITSSAHVEPVAGDANPVCNYSSWRIEVTGSYDPNAILVDEDTLQTTQFPNPPYLDYIIYFQNTGNDTAFTVKILNPIDTFKLQLNTLEFVASSHPMNMKWIPWERNMEFKFDNILLPDSNVNEPMSHGFVRYRIKPKTTLVAGDSIQNNAAIYFDFNQPVMTNTAVTEIVLPTGVSSQWSVVSGQLAVYPNPAQQSITIFSSLMTNDQCQMTIYDLFGREVFQLETKNHKPETKINVSGFSQGIYLIQLKSGEETARAKFVKQ